MQLFSKKLPAWTLLAALVIVGAGAATGLVLKDQIDGTTTIAVSQALLIDGAPVVPTAGSDHDEFLGTADDDGSAWAAHFEANNGDTLVFLIPIVNEGEQDMAAILTLDIVICFGHMLRRPPGLYEADASAYNKDRPTPVKAVW